MVLWFRHQAFARKETSIADSHYVCWTYYQSRLDYLGWSSYCAVMCCYEFLVGVKQILLPPNVHDSLIFLTHWFGFVYGCIPKKMDDTIKIRVVYHQVPHEKGTLIIGYGSIPIDTFLVGWTSIYQLFWCSPGVQGFDTLPIECIHLFLHILNPYQYFSNHPGTPWNHHFCTDWYRKILRRHDEFPSNFRLPSGNLT